MLSGTYYSFEETNANVVVQDNNSFLSKMPWFIIIFFVIFMQTLRKGKTQLKSRLEGGGNEDLINKLKKYNLDPGLMSKLSSK